MPLYETLIRHYRSKLLKDSENDALEQNHINCECKQAIELFHDLQGMAVPYKGYMMDVFGKVLTTIRGNSNIYLIILMFLMNLFPL